MHRQIQQDGGNSENPCGHNGIDQKTSEQAELSMNFDTNSYQFRDLDLKIAAGKLPERDQGILILRLMGHTQSDIAMASGGVTRSMISKRLRIIMNTLARYL